ncbi:hypothetical protein PpBr36_03400 [Pyricularia pennisetigena]|uniref:hypothetical protein n=1 Tax=Pyricularia pennisetigena TaxID=1578925 RepID=UPI00114D63D9|nr:hypothetical protein PpBr36_03400 [Pyricularia pennisetigena]TLS30443.1 hypothetical protein PpBr36_03400 [Pyricularia pennisetigena]
MPFAYRCRPRALWVGLSPCPTTRSRPCQPCIPRKCRFEPSRHFHASPCWRVRLSEMSKDEIASLKVNQERMMKTLHDTCVWGTGKRWGSGPTETGMSRLALTDSDKQVRDWFVETVKDLGCRVKVDSMGNIFAIRRSLPPGSHWATTFAGSHLDTQPTGGRYDGILGMMAGIEMLRVLKENQIETEFPVGVVNWTNEEGARFPVSMIASGAWAEVFGLDQAHNLQEVGGGEATMRSELQRIGYLGEIPSSFNKIPMAAHFELHIEQGPILESNNLKIGVVQGVQAYRWFTIEINGRDAHTGTTPFSARADAILLASRFIVHSHALATSHGALASTGIVELEPGSVNTIPGYVRMSLDIRAPQDSTLDALEADLKRDFDLLSKGIDPPGSKSQLLAGATPGRNDAFSLTWKTDSVSEATKFHPDCVETVRASALSVLEARGLENAQGLIRDMTSGAGHDSVYASRRCPASMIFVPCRDGVSHNPEEYTSPEDCALGADVLLQSILRYDLLRHKTEGGKRIHGQ